LVLHELGTNAQKYGAWAKDGGSVKMDWHLDSQTVKVKWEETFAKAHKTKPTTSPARRGFGSTLIERSVSDYEKTMNANGLVITFSVSMHE
jgi:two-component sensor histidine kinase